MAGMSPFAMGTLESVRDVFLLFTIPVGGGIPAGVVLAQTRGIGWGTLIILYFVSDLLLAVCFEPMMRFFVYLCGHIEFLHRFREAMKKSTDRIVAGYGAKPGPIQLVAIAFGFDPMIGRAAALAAGHGFIAGWTVAITGDMLFFIAIMASTIWLNSILGDGTWTAVIIMVLMIATPALIRRIKERRKPATVSET